MFHFLKNYCFVVKFDPINRCLLVCIISILLLLILERKNTAELITAALLSVPSSKNWMSGLLIVVDGKGNSAVS